MDNEKLNLALYYAIDAHRDQYDKGGSPYILHPLRLMLHFEGDEEAMLVAVLHDVLEDCDPEHLSAYVEAISEDCGDRVLTAVQALTKKPHESYQTYLDRVIQNPLARRVKIADLRHNLDVTRLPTINTATMSRIAKYHDALKYLESEKTYE